MKSDFSNLKYFLDFIHVEIKTFFLPFSFLLVWHAAHSTLFPATYQSSHF